MKTFLSLENIYKTYHLNGKAINVLQGVSFSAERGESMAIIGASGAGKSTLLHIIGGLDKPDRGQVLYESESVYHMLSSKRSYLRAKHIGFIFQSYNLFPEMTVYENVMLPAMAIPARKSDSEIRAMVSGLLSLVGMEGRMSHKPMELSGGEQQRVAIARAIINDPDIILADEPTGNLDSATAKIVLDYLFHFVKENSKTLIIVTHNESVARLCGRVMLLKDGKINSV